MKAAAKSAAPPGADRGDRADATSHREPVAVNPVWRGLAFGGAGLHRKCAACAEEEEDEEHLNRSFQAKPSVSVPSDPAEIEAERVAEQVMRMPDRDGEAPDISLPPRIPILRRSASGTAEAETDSESISRIVERGTSGGGRALNGNTRHLMEARFGRDFGDVRVHTGARAEASAAHVNALAYTVGRDIVFGTGRYAPSTDDGRHLIAHELTHVVQQGGDAAGVATPTVQRVGGALDQRLQQELEEWQQASEEFEADGDHSDAAYALRIVLMLQGVDGDTFADEDALEAFLDQVKLDALDETTTAARTGEFGLVFTKAFPQIWAGRVQDALTLGADPATIFGDWLQAFIALITSSRALGPEIYAHGLPVPFADRGRLQNFRLRITDGKSEKASTVRDYARESIRYTQLKWLSVFAITWETIVDEIAAAVEDGEVVVNYFDWKDFVQNKQAILRDLPARARDRLAATDEELQQIQSDAVSLADAALLVGMASALYSLFGILSGWTEASELFDAALASADKSVAASKRGARIVTALQWAWDNDYFSGAAQEWAQALIANGPEILAEIALILILGMIPGVDIAVAIYLALTMARDVVGMIAELASALNAAMKAKNVGGLQEASAELAQVLTNGAIFILIVLVTEGIGKAAARLRKSAAELRAADRTLTEEAAEKKALEGLSAEEREALEGGPAKVAKKFEEFGGVCSLGSVLCDSLPDQVRAEAGEYPSDYGVPFPNGPFNVQKAALADVERASAKLQAIARANRKAWPHFDRALAEAEKQGKNWVSDSDGPWQVHHIKPVSVGGGNEPGNLVPLPISVHLKFNAFWDKVYRAFRNRFTAEEWDLIYGSEKDVPGSRVPKTRKR